jgi:hypothetical protein
MLREVKPPKNPAGRAVTVWVTDSEDMKKKEMTTAVIDAQTGDTNINIAAAIMVISAERAAKECDAQFPQRQPPLSEPPVRLRSW